MQALRNLERLHAEKSQGQRLGRFFPANYKVRVLSLNERVRHNYADGHGEGTVVKIEQNPTQRLAYQVEWDNGTGTFPYTFNDVLQEILPVNSQ